MEVPSLFLPAEKFLNVTGEFCKCRSPSITIHIFLLLHRQLKRFYSHRISHSVIGTFNPLVQNIRTKWSPAWQERMHEQNCVRLLTPNQSMPSSSWCRQFHWFLLVSVNCFFKERGRGKKSHRGKLSIDISICSVCQRRNSKLDISFPIYGFFSRLSLKTLFPNSNSLGSISDLWQQPFCLLGLHRFFFPLAPI